MIRVYVDMVADLFHGGHVEFLRQARALGDELVVGVHSDDTVEGYKRRPIMTMEERMAVVAGCRYVDEVLANAPLVRDKKFLTTHRVDLVVHGDDFDLSMATKLYGVAMEMEIFRTVPYTPGVSTSDLLERMRRRIEEDNEKS
jgi:cytidyltransferase-like protein